jgi:hypothetical protein
LQRELEVEGVWGYGGECGGRRRELALAGEVYMKTMFCSGAISVKALYIIQGFW